MKPDRTSRRRYDKFRLAYREGRTDELAVRDRHDKRQPASKGQTRRHVFQYLAWLRPYLAPLLIVLGLAATNALLETLPPLFTRYVVDHILLAPDLTTPARLSTLHLIGLLFLAVLVGARLIDSSRSYRLQQ